MGIPLAKNADVLATTDRGRHELKNAGFFARDGEIVAFDMAPVIRERSRNAARLAALHV
jgi:hypothetical protein